MSIDLSPIIARFAGKPAFIAEKEEAWFISCLAKVAEQSEKFDAAASKYDAGNSDFWSDDDSWLAQFRPYNVSNGILTVPVRGVLKNRFPFQFRGYATGYEYISEAMKRGMADPNVTGIVLHVDSPGGAVAGLFDLADKLHAMRGQKPIKAIAADTAASAAYCIASCADSIAVTRTGEVGSIGVIGVHREMSKRLEAEGITVTFIRSKPFKGEGGSLEPLRKETLGRMQAEVDALHDEFVAIVARNRSMEVASVNETNALTFMGEKGVEAGLADEVAAYDDAFLAFSASQSPYQGASTMADQPKADMIALADHTTAIDAAKESAKAEGVSEGAAAERARINAILASDAGKARPLAALNAALKLDADAATVTAFLAELPEEKPAASTATTPTTQPGAGAPEGMLTAAMNGTQNPHIGSEGGNGGDTQASAEDADKAFYATLAGAGLSGFAAQSK